MPTWVTAVEHECRHRLTFETLVGGLLEPMLDAEAAGDVGLAAVELTAGHGETQRSRRPGQASQCSHCVNRFPPQFDRSMGSAMSVESSGNKVRTTSSAVAEKSVSVAATGAIFTAHDGPDGSLIVAVHGDIDMRSAPMFSDFVCSRMSSRAHVTLELTDVDFFGIAGLTVFDAVREYTAGIGATWSVVAGRSVSRLLQVAQLDSTIPMARPSNGR